MRGGVGPMKDYILNDDRWRSEQYRLWETNIFKIKVRDANSSSPSHISVQKCGLLCIFSHFKLNYFSASIKAF